MDPHPCQGCGEMVAKSRRVLLPALLPVVGLVPLVYGFFLSAEGTPLPTKGTILFRIVGVLGLYVALFISSLYFAWRCLPLRLVTEEVDTARRRGRPKLSTAATKSVIPASVFGVVGLMMAHDRGSLVVGPALFAVIWVFLTLAQASGITHKGPGQPVRVSGWFATGVIGTVVLSYFVNAADWVPGAVFAWPVLTFLAWRLTRMKG